MTKYTFSNHEYLFSHGKAPRGTGHWAFIIENASVPGISPETFIDQVSSYRKDTIFWVPGVWTLSEAKKKAAALLAAAEIPATTVYVAP